MLGARPQGSRGADRCFSAYDEDDGYHPDECFSQETASVCRLTAPQSFSLPHSYSLAYSQCFPTRLKKTLSQTAAFISTSEVKKLAELVLMADIRAGDRILTLDQVSGKPVDTRVLYVQHHKQRTPMLRIHYNGGHITLTANHVIYVNKRAAPASAAVVGTLLQMNSGAEGGIVHKVSQLTGDVVNIVTLQGTLLAVDRSSDGSVYHPILASVTNNLAFEPWLPHVAWAMPFTRVSSLLFPSDVQAAVNSVCQKKSDLSFAAITGPILGMLGPPTGLNLSTLLGLLFLFLSDVISTGLSVSLAVASRLSFLYPLHGSS